MPRQPRQAADDFIYHVLNRGNCRMDIFNKPGDFQSFVKLLEEGRRRFDMRILAYILMDNHWHLALWPRRGKDLSGFMQWIGTTHVRRWREHRGNVGQGHLYQGRYKSFIVQSDEHLLALLIYIESNALRARMVKHAQDWPWSSLKQSARRGRSPDRAGALAGALSPRLARTREPIARRADAGSLEIEPPARKTVWR